MSRQVRETILRRIDRKGSGWVFTAVDFPGVPRAEAAEALRRLRRRGRIRRITKGVYHVPRIMQSLGVEVPPDPGEAASAVARRLRHRVTPSGAAAANRLGLSEQVPVKLIYLTDGPAREFSLGRLAVTLVSAPREVVRGGRFERDAVQALLYLGPEGVGDREITRLRAATPAGHRGRLLRKAERVGGWVGRVLVRVAETPEAGANGG